MSLFFENVNIIMYFVLFWNIFLNIGNFKYDFVGNWCKVFG